MMAGPLFCGAAAITAFVHYIWLDAPPQAKTPYVIMMLAIVGVTVWGNFVWLRIRRVRIDAQNFYVSNYLIDEITIPLGQVAGVSQRYLDRNRLLTLHLATKTKLGDTINFLPPAFDTSKFNQPHPLVEELCNLIAASQDCDG